MQTPEIVIVIVIIMIMIIVIIIVIIVMIAARPESSWDALGLRPAPWTAAVRQGKKAKSKGKDTEPNPGEEPGRCALERLAEECLWVSSLLQHIISDA